MKIPKMIVFDYGQTLVDEEPFNGLKGTEAVIREATNNSHSVSTSEIQSLANELNRDMGRFGTDFERHPFIEIHNHKFQNYLYEYFGIELTKPSEEVERIFWTAATSAKPTKNINKLLKFLENKNIRTGVISNISFSGKVLAERIREYIPSHRFEFIIASSEYIFRKPHRRIFELALRKARLEPHEVWYCGDNAVFDIDGAAACGIHPVWYKGAIDKTNKYVPKNDCLQVGDWNEIIDLLMALEDTDDTLS